jgi:hypothetical protein
MKTLLLTIALALTWTCSQAQILVFKNRFAGTITGGGYTKAFSVTGYTVVDESSGTITRVEISTIRKEFRVLPLPDWHISTVTGPGRDYTVYSQATSYTTNNGNLQLDCAMLKGLNVSTEIGASQRWMVPRVMTVVGRSVSTTANGQPQIEEATGTLTLFLKDTIFYNQSSMSLETVIDLIRADLSSSYTEVH